jgi:radical SAM-linked protein
MRVIERALSRTGIPLSYSNGFNPHLRLAIALPLSLGQEGLDEWMDVTFEDIQQVLTLPGKINPFLPEGVRINRADRDTRGAADFCVGAYRANCQTKLSARELSEIFDKTTHLEKRMKKGDSKPIPLSDVLLKYSFSDSNSGLSADLLLRIQNPGFNPEALFKQILSPLDPDATWEITRVKILTLDDCLNSEKFRTT